jgi:hypothetical protein
MNVEIELLNNDSDDIFQKEPNETNPNETNPNETNPNETNPNETNPNETIDLDTDSNNESHINIDMDIDMDIDNDTFVQSANRGYVNENVNVNGTVNGNVNESFQKDSKTQTNITYNISKQKKIIQLKNEFEEVSNKSTIYEYHFEKLNKIYDAIGFINLIIDLLLVLVGSISLADILSFEPEIIVIALGFTNGIFTGISKLFKYKDKIAYIGKYMSDLEHLKDEVNIMLIKIDSENISDQDYFKQLEKINLVITNGNFAIFNIDSQEYYNYYDRMKQIKEKKRKINHEICLEKERNYNIFSKRHLEYLSERFTMKKKLKDIHEQVKANNINDFYESDVFTITNLTASEE